jgi:hypothetical protein
MYAPCNMPLIFVSDAYLARPVDFTGPSSRLMRFPITLRWLIGGQL